VANRDRHRPGLVYGPVRPSGPRDTGRFFGNLLGLLVVIATVGILIFAVFFFLQGRDAGQPSASPTSSPPASAASAAPSAEPTPTEGAPGSIAPTPEPSVAPSGRPTKPPITPPPTIFVPNVMVGPGFVTFGTTLDTQLQVTDPKTTFAVDEPMVWSAYLTETASSSDLVIRILVFDPSKLTGQRLVREDGVKPFVSSAQIFVRRLLPIGTTYGPGLYTIEYLKGEQILATGSFLVQ
jgi:hypothetical protein